MGGTERSKTKGKEESLARTTRVSFLACGSSVITSSDLRELADRSLSGDAPSSMSKPFQKQWITRIGSRVPVPKRMGEFGASVHRSGGSICSRG